jgi:hypothetical protein
MIMPQTMLNVADNSGAQRIMCIHVLGGTAAVTLGSGISSWRPSKRPSRGRREEERGGPRGGGAAEEGVPS